MTGSGPAGTPRGAVVSDQFSEAIKRGAKGAEMFAEAVKQIRIGVDIKSRSSLELKEAIHQLGAGRSAQLKGGFLPVRLRAAAT